MGPLFEFLFSPAAPLLLGRFPPPYNPSSVDVQPLCTCFQAAVGWGVGVESLDMQIRVQPPACSETPRPVPPPSGWPGLGLSLYKERQVQVASRGCHELIVLVPGQ